MLRHAARSAARAVATSQRRSLASEAAVEIPAAVDTAGRYANALFNAAKKTNSMDVVTTDVNRMQEMQQTIPVLDQFLSNPTLTRAAKVETLGQIISRSDFSPTFSQFLMVMAENGRTGETANALQTFQDIVATLKGEVVCKVTTTVPLSEWELALIKKKVKSRFFSEKPDTELTLETALDESLIGGLTIQVGDRFMDLSTRTELRKLQEVIVKST